MWLAVHAGRWGLGFSLGSAGARANRREGRQFEGDSIVTVFEEKARAGRMGLLPEAHFSPRRFNPRLNGGARDPKCEPRRNDHLARVDRPARKGAGAPCPLLEVLSRWLPEEAVDLVRDLRIPVILLHSVEKLANNGLGRLRRRLALAAEQGRGEESRNKKSETRAHQAPRD